MTFLNSLHKNYIIRYIRCIEVNIRARVLVCLPSSYSFNFTGTFIFISICSYWYRCIRHSLFSLSLMEIQYLQSAPLAVCFFLEGMMALSGLRSLEFSWNLLYLVNFNQVHAHKTMGTILNTTQCSLI